MATFRQTTSLRGSVVACVVGLMVCHGAMSMEGKAEDASSPLKLRYQFKDGLREVYTVRLETGDDTDRSVREGNVTYQFNAPSAIGFSLEIVLDASSTRVLGGYQIGARQIIGNARVKSGPIKFSSHGDPSEASTANRTRPIPGDAQALIVIPLAEDAGRRWTREETIKLTFTPRNGQSRTCDAVETDTYVIQKVVDQSVAIERTKTLATKDLVDGKPMWELSMKGTIVLGRDGGLPLEGEWAGTITSRDARSEVRTPFRESFRRLSEQARKALEAEAAKKKAEGDRFHADLKRLEPLQNVPVSLRKPATKAALDKVLTDLKSKDIKLVEAAIESLFKMRPDPARRQDVLAALGHQQHSDSSFVAFGVMRLKRDWENAVAVAPPSPAKGGKGKDDKAGGNSKLSAEQQTEMLGLIGELSAESPRQRSASASALANYPDVRVAKALSAAMIDVFVRREATQALKNLGPMAADAVIQHLSSGDHFLVRSSIEVLKAQGTKKHVEPLQKLLLTERNGIIQRDVREAIAAMQTRD